MHVPVYRNHWMICLKCRFSWGEKPHIQVVQNHPTAQYTIHQHSQCVYRPASVSIVIVSPKEPWLSISILFVWFPWAFSKDQYTLAKKSTIVNKKLQDLYLQNKNIEILVLVWFGSRKDPSSVSCASKIWRQLGFFCGRRGQKDRAWCAGRWIAACTEGTPG